LDKPPTQSAEKVVRSKSSPRIASIKNRIETFGQAKLDQTHTDFALTLCDKIARMRKLNIMGGREEIWAASIVQVIARVNFLFDPQNDLSIESDDLCNFFGTKKSTVGNKAGQIQKVCGIHVGHPEFSTPEIIKMLSFFETEDGFLISGALLDKHERDGQYNETDLKSWAEKESDPNRRGKKKRRRTTKKNDNDHQLKLFDDG
jgi:hypothetical protein